MSGATILVLVVCAMAVAWWLSGYDSGVKGEDVHADFMRRAIRCGVTLVLLVIAFAGFFPMQVFLAVGIIWASCGAEFLARQFHNLFDPEDKRDFDPTHG